MSGRLRHAYLQHPSGNGQHRPKEPRRLRGNSGGRHLRSKIAYKNPPQILRQDHRVNGDQTHPPMIA